MNILVTGGAGFIGSNLCERLWRNGNNIICLDNLVTGNKENIKHLIGKERFKFLEWDIANSIQMDMDINQIYNLACLVPLKLYKKKPLRTIETNILGIMNMLKLAKDKHSKILHASTSTIYGESIMHPQTKEYCETVNPTGIRGCYDEGKRVAETIMMAYYSQYKTDIKIVRIFNTYGPNMGEKDGLVVSQFITQALKNEDITIYGNGNQTISFCYIDDLIDGLIIMMNSSITGPLNLGNPEEISILEFAKKIKEITHSKSKVVFLPIPKDDPEVGKPDITLTRKYLQWEPKINLQRGLRRTVLYLKKNIVKEQN